MALSENTIEDKIRETDRLAMRLHDCFVRRQAYHFMLPEVSHQIIRDLSGILARGTVYLKPYVSALRVEGEWLPVSKVDVSVAERILSEAVRDGRSHYDAMTDTNSCFSVDHGLYSILPCLVARAFSDVMLNDYYLSTFHESTRELAEHCRCVMKLIGEAASTIKEKQSLASELRGGGMRVLSWRRAYKSRYGSERLSDLEVMFGKLQCRFHISGSEALGVSHDLAEVSGEINGIIESMMGIQHGILLSVARPYLRGSRFDDEVMCAAREGMVRACVKYNPRVNGSFYAFAKRWIIQRIVSHIDANSSALSVNHDTGTYQRKLRKARSDLNRSGQKASIHTVAKTIGVPEIEIVALDAAYAPVVPLDGPSSDREDAGSGGAFQVKCDCATPEEAAFSSQAVDIIDRLLSNLNNRDANVLRARYGIGCATQTLEQLASTFGVSAERVRQIQANAECHLFRLAKKEGFGLESLLSA